MPRDGHRLAAGGGGAAGVVVPQRLRLGDFHVVERVKMRRAGLPVAVRRLVLEHQHERFVGRAIILQPCERLVGNDVRRVAGVFLDDHFARVVGRTHRRIVIRPLPNQDVEVIKTGRNALEVPLADHRRLVTHLAQQLRERLLRTVERRSAVHQKPVQVTVLAGEDHRAAWPADRVGDVTLAESHALLRDTIHVRRLVDARAIRADRPRRVVVGENEEDIRPLSRLGWGRGHQAANQAKRHQRHSFFNHVFHGKINLPAKLLNPVLVKAAL